MLIRLGGCPGYYPRHMAYCQVAEHYWDPVGHAIVTYGYLFKRLIQARQREV